MFQYNMTLNGLKYFFAKLTKSQSYLDAINDNFLDKLLGHHKIIGWHNGCPVYSSFLVPGLSKPLGNLISNNLIKSMNNEPIPGIANIGITDKCNCNCEHCSFFGAMDKTKNKKLLSNIEMKKTINECIDLGVNVINFVGGEPLLREDLCELISSVNKDKAVCSLFTNGWMLKEKARSLKKAGLMQVNVSLDSTRAEIHDKFRRKDGLFRRVIGGIKEARRQGLLTCISTTVTQETLTNGEFEKMLILAKNLKVNEILVFDMLSAGMYSHIYAKKEKIDLDLLNKIVKKYNSKPNFPGIVSYSFIRSKFGCSAGRNFFYISPYGDIHPCDFSSGIFGNLRSEKLEEIWNKLVVARNKIEYFNVNCKFCQK